MSALRHSISFVLQSVTVGLALAFIVVWLRPDWFAEAVRDRGKPTGSYADAVAAAAPAVVNVHTARRVAQRRNPLLDDPLYRRFFGNTVTPPPDRVETSLGSGVIIGEQGYVLTNNHVVAGAEDIQIALADGRIATARVVGVDPETDLALLHIDLAPLPAMRIARADALRVGDVVLAIGNPYGFGQTVTQGIVSGTGRNYLGLNTFENFIQTDAAINPGNSGGALVNARGELVGINTAYYARSGGSQGIGFAIPVDLARGVMQHLVEHGRVIRGWLGVEPQALTRELADALALPVTGGVIVAAVYANSPAAEAGLQSGDIITHVAGEPVADPRDALNRIAALPPGSEVALVIWRDGASESVAVKVGERRTPGR
ncbi:MAG: trypsin-like peptidase domain-containing protein [Xanthomonadaceae bacterium]|nr:trypsin-like peptidase domain-containing protein [Xanthomonadaceae bacterium]